MGLLQYDGVYYSMTGSLQHAAGRGGHLWELAVKAYAGACVCNHLLATERRP